MVIKMYLAGKDAWIEKEQVIALDNKAITYYQAQFPNANVEWKLKLLSQLFWYLPSKRCQSKRELDERIRKWIMSNVNDESFISRFSTDYIDIELKEELERIFYNERY